MRTLVALVLAVMVVPTLPATGSLTWSVAPAGPKAVDGRPSLQYKLDPGATLTDHVAVTNHSRQPLTVRLYASDAFTTSGGGFDLLAGDRPPADVGAWVKTGQGTVVLPSTSQVIVPVTITVPRNATPGDHVGGIVAALIPGTAGTAGNQVSVDHRVGTRIYLRVTGPLRPELAVGEVKVTKRTSWNPFRLPSVTSEFTVANTGNVRLTGRPSIRTHGLFGLGDRTTVDAALPQILPGGAIRTTIRVDGVPPLLRTWVSTAVWPVQPVGQPLDPSPVQAVSHTTIWLMPWPQLTLLAVVAAAVLAWLLVRRRRRRQMAAALAAAEQRGRERAVAGATVPPKPTNEKDQV